MCYIADYRSLRDAWSFTVMGSSFIRVRELKMACRRLTRFLLAHEGNWYTRKGSNSIKNVFYHHCQQMCTLNLLKGSKFFPCTVDPFPKGLSKVHVSQLEITEVVFWSQNGRESARCIHSPEEFPIRITVGIFFWGIFYRGFFTPKISPVPSNKKCMPNQVYCNVDCVM